MQALHCFEIQEREIFIVCRSVLDSAPNQLLKTTSKRFWLGSVLV